MKLKRSTERKYSNSKGMFGWLRNSLAMSVRQRNTADELAAVRKAQAEKGEQSVFDTLPEEVTVKSSDVMRKYTEVCTHRSSSMLAGNPRVVLV